MESYGEFAAVYDRLMDDFDYPRWAEYYLELISKAGVKVRKMCDCACGTGSMTIQFAKRGINVTGMDLSRDMLEVAAVKARRAAQKIVFTAQDMTRLELPRPVDAIVCACDGVNYLTETGAPEAFFKAAYAALKPGGCLAFDISSRHKLEKVIGNGFFGEEQDEVAYIWSNKLDEANHIVDMDLTFFVRQENELYRRFEESHRQRAHSADEMVTALENSGFTDIKVYGNMNFEAPADDEIRIHFTAVRK
ncbi:MAG: class I SAM-dependent methyltransferase [Clostridia bacterium]|nr:class I SAM-dependent methyltransferase [Clostridia bacterium]